MNVCEPVYVVKLLWVSGSITASASFAVCLVWVYDVVGTSVAARRASVGIVGTPDHYPGTLGPPLQRTAPELERRPAHIRSAEADGPRVGSFEQKVLARGRRLDRRLGLLAPPHVVAPRQPCVGFPPPSYAPSILCGSP